MDATIPLMPDLDGFRAKVLTVKPRELHCHPSMVEVIGQEVMGVPVLGVGKALRVFLLVPQEV